jgi:hypothetical protein
MWIHTLNNIMFVKKITSMGKIKRMDQVRLILRTYQRCSSFKETARRLKMSKNTIKHYVKIAHRSSIDLDRILALDQEAF